METDLSKIDLSKAEEPELHDGCHRCGAISIGKEDPDLHARLDKILVDFGMDFLLEEEPGWVLVRWWCVDCGHIMKSWELPKEDRKFLRSNRIQSSPWQEIKVDIP